MCSLLRRSSSVVTAAIVCLSALYGCGGGDSIGPPTTGSLKISTTTTGLDPDADGYAVSVDDGSTQLIGSTADLTVSLLSAGQHKVTLSEVAANCLVSGTNPRDVNVPAGGTGEVSFTVACTAAPGGIMITDLGILPNDLDNKESVAWGLNSATPVQVVGHSTVSVPCCNNVHGFLWTQASGLSDLGTLGPTGQSFAYAISDGGTIVGIDDGPVAVIWPSGGVKTTLPLLASVFGGGAEDITADGSAIVGANFAAPGGVYAEYAVIWSGPPWTIDSIGPGHTLGVSENHLVVGSTGANFPTDGRAVVWTKGVGSWTAAQLDTGPSEAWDINPAGDRIAGHVREGGRVLAVVWVNNGATWARTDLASLGGMTSQALGVNNAGWVVGSSTLAGGTVRAVVWKPGTSGYSPPQDLGSLEVDGESVAQAINENRQIVGFSSIVGLSSQDPRDTHAVLWTVP